MLRAADAAGNSSSSREIRSAIGWFSENECGTERLLNRRQCHVDDRCHHERQTRAQDGDREYPLARMGRAPRGVRRSADNSGVAGLSFRDDHAPPCRVAALPAPNERERTQWYFQRYVAHLPGGGEIVLFDRSWYNRAGVERVMGFCTDEEYEEFLHSVPEFERMLVRSGIVLIKYWFSITDQEQHFRFMMRINDPLKQWKLSPMDLESRSRWELYTKAKEAMLERTHIPEAPWWIIEAVDKKRARLNCIAHLLKQIPYEEIPRPELVLPERVHNPEYHRGPIPREMYVPAVY
jgi:polyphosphate kinase